jgi:hypothetical protein
VEEAAVLAVVEEVPQVEVEQEEDGESAAAYFFAPGQGDRFVPASRNYPEKISFSRYRSLFIFIEFSPFCIVFSPNKNKQLSIIQEGIWGAP